MKTKYDELKNILATCYDFKQTTIDSGAFAFVDGFISEVSMGHLTSEEAFDLIEKIPPEALNLVGTLNTNIASFVIQENTHYIHFNSNQIFSLFSKVDLNALYKIPSIDPKYGLTLGMMIAQKNVDAKLHLSSNQLCILFSRCDFTLKNRGNETLPSTIATLNQYGLGLSFKQFCSLYPEQKGIVFQKEAGIFYVMNPHSSDLTPLEINQKIKFLNHEKTIKNYISTVRTPSEMKYVDEWFEGIRCDFEKNHIKKSLPEKQKNKIRIL